MKENCFDEGTIQAFLDGELGKDLLENTARHLAVCGDCASKLATAEDETAFAFSALEQEFSSTLVPTQRLWAKINDSIERERKPFWQAVFAFLRSPAMAAFAAFLLVFGIFVAYLNSSNNTPTEFASTTKIEQAKPSIASAPVPLPVDVPLTSTENEDSKNLKVINAKFESKPQRNSSPATLNQTDVPITQPAVYDYMPGEESYIKTIAALEKTVDDGKDEILKPSSRVAFEKDLALVNDAIKKMQVEVRKNPKNEAARQVLLDSYQSKVDLLNSVTNRTELMASIR